MRVTSLVLSPLALFLVAACSGNTINATPGGNATGGSINAGGNTSTGGTANVAGNGTGGSVSTGGVNGVGGTVAGTGGNVPTGGTSSTAGGNATGGKLNTGGTSSAAGGNATGGTISTATGGKANTGGTSTNGGTATTGGTRTSTGGSTSTTPGGAAATGGTSSAATGGTTTAGGSASACAYKPVPNSSNTTNFNPTAWYTSWKSKFYVDCGNGMARIANGQGSGNTVSEGIGYGMLLAVGAGDRTAFDAIWAFYKGHVDVNGLMNWSVNNCTTQAPGSNDNFAATDGDEDAAMALVQADAKWGGYTTDAKNLIGLIKKYETSQTTTPTYLRPGDAANNGGRGEGVVNPSYFAPGYWHAWATYTGDASWNTLATDAYVMLAKFQALTISNSTNLVPDWGKSDGTNSGSGYSYDACRTPWRVAVDYVWFCTPEAKTFLQNISTYVDGKGGVASVPFDKNSAFLGPFALSGMAISQTKADTYLNAWLSAQMDDTPYFQGSLRGLFLLLANETFPSGQ